MKSLYNDADYATIRDSLSAQMKDLQVKFKDTNPTVMPPKVSRKQATPEKGKAKGKGKKASE